MPISGHAPGSSQVLSLKMLTDVQADTKRAWAVDALCAGIESDLFFPSAGHPAAEAQKVCTDCPVRDQCLAYSVIADEPFGIWGGLDYRERHALRRQLQRRGQMPPPVADSAA